MNGTASKWVLTTWSCALMISAFGCDEAEVYTSATMPKPATSAVASASASAKVANADKAPAAGKTPVVSFTEADFVESSESRDPFRDYRSLFVAKDVGKRGGGQKKVKAVQFALDELKLQAIISHRIMLTDPTGHGWIVYNGDWVGKPELVSVGGTDGAEVAINWRVDRIRASDVVFIREDASHPEIPPTTRVVPLYPAGEGS